MESHSEYIDAYNMRFITNEESDEISTIIGIIDKLYDDSRKPRLKSMYNPHEKALIKEMFIQTSQCKASRTKIDGDSKL